MGFFDGVKKLGGNIKNAVVKGAKDTVNEVKRHPGTYATLGALATGGTLAAAGGLGGIASKLGGAKKVAGAATTATDGSWLPGVGQAGQTADPGRFRSVLGGVGDFLGEHGDSILDVGQAAEGVYDKYRDVNEYNKRKPLRDAGMAALLDTSRPDLSGVFADPGAPQQYRTVNVGSRGRI